MKRSYSAEELAAMLRRVPEVSLLDLPTDSKSGEAKADERTEISWQDLKKSIKVHREDFLNRLLARRPDLAGLPFLKGKDCQLSWMAARNLQQSSQRLRDLFSTAFRDGTRSRDPKAEESVEPPPLHFWHDLAIYGRQRRPEDLPALEQILTGEKAPWRLGLIQSVLYPPASPAAPLLARRALFDTSEQVRRAAVAGLSDYSPQEYVPLLLKGLQYPWPPVNCHAAEALVALGAEPAVPELIKLLDAADPCAPFEIEQKGRKVLAVRELVRLNHNGNCLLCHAPSFDRSDPVRGGVPSPALDLPPRFSPAYYYGLGVSTSRLFVRADITYLRQDFSEIQPVENPGKWPTQQRFDFLVRVRTLTEKEVAARQARERSVGPLSLPASKEAILFALRELAGVDGGTAAASWQQALQTRQGPRPAGP